MKCFKLLHHKLCCDLLAKLILLRMTYRIAESNWCCMLCDDASGRLSCINVYSTRQMQRQSCNRKCENFPKLKNFVSHPFKVPLIECLKWVFPVNRAFLENRITYYWGIVSLAQLFNLYELRHLKRNSWQQSDSPCTSQSATSSLTSQQFDALPLVEKETWV